MVVETGELKVGGVVVEALEVLGRAGEELELNVLLDFFFDWFAIVVLNAHVAGIDYVSIRSFDDDTG